MKKSKLKNSKLTTALKAFDMAIKSMEEAYKTVTTTEKPTDIQGVAVFEDYLDSFESNSLAICDDILDQYNRKIINKRQLGQVMKRHEEMGRVCQKIQTYIDKNWK